ncbi:MAG: tetratricopeptide repeat protein [Candidatus Kapabacteria bacterium]|jgi:class 3 adenylate cyclase|nr:tetratricopeptide repeat protein [Candidatus Kapabacteria bacterium]
MKSFLFRCFPALLLVLALQNTAPALAQTRDIDSLQALLLRTPEQDTMRVQMLLELARLLYSQNPTQMERVAREALNIAERKGFQKGIANGMLQIGRSLHVRSRYAEAMDYVTQANNIFETLRDTAGIASTLHATGNVYLEQANYDDALRVFLSALSYREQIGDKRGMSNTLNNLGILYKQQGKFDDALKYYQQSLTLAQQMQRPSALATAFNNIGLLYQELNRYDSAEYYIRRSLAIEETIGRKQGITMSIHSLGVLYGLRGKNDSALILLWRALALKRETKEQQSIVQTLNELSVVQLRTHDYIGAISSASEAFATAQQINTKADIKTAAEHLADAYKAQGKFADALRYRELAMQYRDSVFSEEKERQMSRLETKYQLSKKQMENEALRRNNAAQERFITLVVVACFVALAFLFYFVYANNRKKLINAELQRQQHLLEEQAVEIETTNSALHEANQQSERLLHNIFPQAIVERLRAGETKIAERFDNVSVLFADIAGFTPLAQQLEPVVLVAVLDEIFSVFDDIAERFGLEKIKTIGDSYMLVSGVPRQRTDHAEAIAMAAIAMQGQITLKNDILRRMGRTLQMRIGIHTGEVVAGVIGSKKFAYDLWGDTVNIANRMESHGVGGAIHVSEAFVQCFDTAINDKLDISGKRRITAYPRTLHSDLHKRPDEMPRSIREELRSFIFEERGNIEIKGKGTMKTYFLRFD